MNCGWKLIQRPGSSYFLGFSLSEISPLWCLFCFVFLSPLNTKRVSLSCLQGHKVNLISLHSLGMSLAFKWWLGGVLCACGALCKTDRSFHSSVSQQHSAVLSVKCEASHNLHVIADELSRIRPLSTYCSVSCCSLFESLSHTGGGLPRLPPSPVMLFHLKKHHRFLFVCLVCLVCRFIVTKACYSSVMPAKPAVLEPAAPYRAVEASVDLCCANCGKLFLMLNKDPKIPDWHNLHPGLLQAFVKS